MAWSGIWKWKLSYRDIYQYPPIRKWSHKRIAERTDYFWIWWILTNSCLYWSVLWNRDQWFCCHSCKDCIVDCRITDDERDRRHRSHESGFPAVDDKCVYCGRQFFTDWLGERCTKISGFVYYGKSSVCGLFTTEQRTEKWYFIGLRGWKRKAI